jgi:uncharacterized membrane protein
MLKFLRKKSSDMSVFELILASVVYTLVAAAIISIVTFIVTSCINNGVTFVGTYNIIKNFLFISFRVNLLTIIIIIFVIIMLIVIFIKINKAENYKLRVEVEKLKNEERDKSSILSIDTSGISNTEELKIKNDYESLNAFLGTICIPAFDMTFQTISDSNIIIGDILHYFDGMRAYVDSIDFYFYDDFLSNEIIEFYKSMNKLVSYSNYFYSYNRNFKLTTDSTEIEADFRKDAGLAMDKMKSLLNYIKRNYPNIDFVKTNKVALADKKKYSSMFED